MSDSLEKQINDVCQDWSKKIAEDLNASLEKALRDSGTTRPQIDLVFTNTVLVDKDGNAKVSIIASGDYWDYINKGVDGTKVKHGSPYSYKKKAVDFDAIAKWITSNSIDAAGILLTIDLKKKGLTVTNKELKKLKKGIDRMEAVGKLSRMIAVKVARDGHEPKPYIDTVLTQARIDLLTNRISAIMGREITASFKIEGLSNIKLTV